jgi:hypothetical protein
MDRLVTNSELSTFKRCRRKWWLAFYRQLGPMNESKTGVRKLGTRIHEALAGYYAPESLDPIISFKMSIQVDIALHPELEAELTKDLDLGVKMLEGYLQWVEENGIDAGLHVYATETKVQAPFGEIRDRSIFLLGKLDARAITEWDGMRWFIDHKSVGSLTAPLDTLQMDTQMKHYHLLEIYDLIARDENPADGVIAAGGMYNMMRRVKRTARANPPFYHREFVRHNRTELQNYARNVRGLVHEMLTIEDVLNEGSNHQEIVPPTPRDTCRWDCDFKLVCPMFDDGSNAEGMLERYYTTRDPLERYDEKVDEGEHD